SAARSRSKKENVLGRLDKLRKVYYEENTLAGIGGRRGAANLGRTSQKTTAFGHRKPCMDRRKPISRVRNRDRKMSRGGGVEQDAPLTIVSSDRGSSNVRWHSMALFHARGGTTYPLGAAPQRLPRRNALALRPSR